MPESSRSFWKGYLRLALVSIPVRLVAAERTESEIRLHQVDRDSKQRIRYLKAAPGKGEVKKEDIVSAYEVEPGNYVFLEEEELGALKLASRHTIELAQFVASDEINPIYFDRPYFLLPDGEATEDGYRVLRDALYAKRRTGVGQLTLRGRENLVALFADAEGQGLILQTLRYESELKNAAEIFSGVGREKTRADMVRMAEELIDSRTAAFDPGKFKNHYAAALRELVEAKLSKGLSVPIEEEQAPGAKVLDFMEALKRSVDAGAKAETPRSAGPTKKASARTPAKPLRKSTAKRRA